MILQQLIPADSGRGEPVNMRISSGTISAVSAAPILPGLTGPLRLHFEDALVFPGLINSHDHLDFNLFPQLGSQFYNSYTEWGSHIHTNHKEEIAQVLKVPVTLREQWGVLKNLVCGITTVVNHGAPVTLQERLISIYEHYHCLHSVQFEQQWKLKLNNPAKLGRPVVIHVGEGTNEAASEEIDRLTRWNLLGKPLIGVHAVAMSVTQARKFEAIVWCPQSNYFLLDETAPVDQLQKYTRVLFGTDSTLTSHWDIWEHIRTARATGLLADMELYQTLNANPAAIWKTQNGRIQPGYKADLVVSKRKAPESGIVSFFANGPEDLLLVLHQGNIRLFDESLLPQLDAMDLAGFSRIHINGARKYVQADVPALIRSIQHYYPEASFPFTADEP